MNSKRLLVSVLVPIAVILVGAAIWFQFKPKPENKTNGLPPEKQTIEDRYAQERTEGQKNPAPKNSQISTGTLITLGQEFILKTGETARVGNTEYYLQLQQYRDINNPTSFEYTFIASEGYPLISDQVPYDVVVKDTDYKTYAKLIVNSADSACASKTGNELDQCWNKLAQRFSNTNYCNKIQSQDIKSGCFEYLAATTENPSQLCQQKVISPKSYCQLFNLSYWKTFSSLAYGLSIQYPPGLFKANSNADNSLNVTNLYPIGTDESPYAGTELSGISIKIVPFSTEFNVAMDSYKLHYDSNNNVWIKSSWDDAKNTYADNQSCEQVKPLGAQQIPAYDVSYKYKREYVSILKQGLLYISEEPEEQPIPPEAHKSFDMMLNSIILDHPESVVKAKCN